MIAQAAEDGGAIEAERDHLVPIRQDEATQDAAAVRVLGQLLEFQSEASRDTADRAVRHIDVGQQVSRPPEIIGHIAGGRDLPDRMQDLRLSILHDDDDAHGGGAAGEAPQRGMGRQNALKEIGLVMAHLASECLERHRAAVGHLEIAIRIATEGTGAETTHAADRFGE